MHFGKQDLWDSFKKSLIETINETPKLDLENGWMSCGDRTLLYFDYLLPNLDKPEPKR